MACVVAPVSRPLAASARPLPRLPPSAALDRARAARSSAGSSTACSWPMCWAIYDVYGGTESRQRPWHHADAGAEPRSPAAGARDGGRNIEHLGFGVTVTLSYEPPFPFRPAHVDARPSHRWAHRLEHRDRLPRQCGARRQAAQRGHDDRYAAAEDYMALVYKLWEGSWADDAVVADRRRACSPGPTGSGASRTRARTTGSMRSTSASPRRPSRDGMPNASSCRVRRNR